MIFLFDLLWNLQFLADLKELIRMRKRKRLRRPFRPKPAQSDGKPVQRKWASGPRAGAGRPSARRRRYILREAPHTLLKLIHGTSVLFT